MTTTLITGSNKGLSYETARQLVAAGHTVYIGPETPSAAARPRNGWAHGSSSST
jgi:NAD(P)-dependent dehydrogenase (short-subunit alcohol dehydrogenase family)